MASRSAGGQKNLWAVAIAAPCVLAMTALLYLSGSPGVETPSGVPPPPADVSTARAVAELPPTVTAPAVPPGEPASTPTPLPPPVNPAEQTAGAARRDALAEAIGALVQSESGVYGVVVATGNGELLYERNADLPFQAASLYKLVLLADVLAGLESGAVDPGLTLWLSPDYFPLEGEPADSYFDASWVDGVVTLEEALFATGAYSSNVAARALLSITDPASLQATARRIGMEDTYFFANPATLDDWPPAPAGADPVALEQAVRFVEAQAADGPVNITTPRDIATFFAGLLTGAVVSPEASAAILDILGRQAVDDRFPCFVPPETAMAHKTGNLDHVVHDAGIIWGPAGPTILVAMVEDPDDDLIATRVLQRLALIAYDSAAPVPELPGNGTPGPTCASGAPS